MRPDAGKQWPMINRTHSPRHYNLIVVLATRVQVEALTSQGGRSERANETLHEWDSVVGLLVRVAGGRRGSEGQKGGQKRIGRQGRERG